MSSPTIRVREGILADLRELRRIPSDEALARMIGVDRKTLYRINEGSTPSPAFIAGTIRTFQLPFDAMFQIVDEPARTSAVA